MLRWQASMRLASSVRHTLIRFADVDLNAARIGRHDMGPVPTWKE